LRILTLALIGTLSGVLFFTAMVMLLRLDMSGDTSSPQLALILMASSIALVITAVGVATAAPWSRGLRLAVGIASAFVGFGGLMLMLGASLIAAGMFPDTLLSPLNLTIQLVMGLTGLTGVGLLTRGSNLTMEAGAGGSWLILSWHPVAAGIAIGIAVAWTWSVIIWPLIPYTCCLA
jgi:hypothetical protein